MAAFPLIFVILLAAQSHASEEGNVSSEAVEICSCGLKALVNGSDSFFLKSPKYTSHPSCLWEFHVESDVSLVLNCFMHAIKGFLVGESECSSGGDSLAISIDGGEEEIHCNPFHHFSKHIHGPSKGRTYLLSMSFKREQKFETEGESFECSINGYFEDQSIQDAVESEPAEVNQEICGKVNFPLRRMKNGDIISPEEYPWMVPLSIEGAKLCGGIIVDKNWILTSAHCLDKAHWVKIYFGVREYGFSETSQTVQDFKIHPDYDFPHNDIALIKLPKTLEFNRYVRPVCLPSQPEDEEGYMAFGWSTIRGDEVSRYLRGVHLHELNIQDCQNMYGLSNLSSLSFLCTNSSTKCSLNSDQEPEFSASSLGRMLDDQFEIHGLASFTSNSCNTSIPTGFTKVFPYMSWIRSHLRNNAGTLQLLPIFDILDHGF